MTMDHAWRAIPVGLLTVFVLAMVAFAETPDDASPQTSRDAASTPIEQLRAAYAGPPETWPAFVVDEGVDAQELGTVPPVTHPDDNPPSAAKAKLGKQLFFDPRLSRSNQMSCASCHDPDLGWADGRTVSFGTDRLELPRNSPTVLGSGHFDTLFWDGRADSLEDLTLQVITNADEMHGVGDMVANKIGMIPEYRSAFAAVFDEDKPKPKAGPDGRDRGPRPARRATNPVTLDRIGQAVAAFVRTLEPGRSRFDRFLRRVSDSGDTSSFTDEELSGLHLYRTRAKCMNCHHGPMLTDGLTHVTGLHLYTRPKDYDIGAFEVTGDPADRGAFKTPHLRHIERTAPYMHHGLFESLAVTVRAYNGGMRIGRPRGKYLDDPEFPTLSPLIHPLGLTEDDVQAIAAFLRTLTEPHRRVAPPELPRGLYGRD
ncbi:MAG: cytochrome c peroxidase [Planctomycetota bacterium]